MKQSEIEDIEEITSKIQEGEFSRALLRSLFTILRWNVDKDTVLFDIANFVAHSNEREKGIVHGYVENFINKFTDINLNGGSFKIPTHPYDQDRVCDELAQFLFKNKINNFSEQKIADKKFELMKHILSLVAETNIKINKQAKFKDFVYECSLSKVEDTKTGQVVYLQYKQIADPRLSTIVYGYIKVPVLAANR